MLLTASSRSLHLGRGALSHCQGERYGLSQKYFRWGISRQVVLVPFGGKADITLGSPGTWLLTPDVRSLPSVTVCKPISILLHFFIEP